MNITNISSNDTLAKTPVWLIYLSELTIWYKVMIFLTIVGTVSNFLLIVTIFSSRKLRSGCGALIANLHLLLLFQCTINMPIVFIAMYQVSLDNPPSKTFCRWTFFVYYVIVQVIDWADMMVGINRFVAICFPFSYPKWTSRRVLISMVVISWIPGLVICLCFLFGVGGMFRPLPPWGGCGIALFSPLIAHWNFTIGMAFPVASLGTHLTGCLPKNTYFLLRNQ